MRTLEHASSVVLMPDKSHNQKSGFGFQELHVRLPDEVLSGFAQNSEVSLGRDLLVSELGICSENPASLVKRRIAGRPHLL